MTGPDRRHDPFGRTSLPADLKAKDPGRARRVALVAEVGQDLLAGRLPRPEARLFVAGGILALLEVGGDIARDHWRIAAPPGSHHNPTFLWRFMRDQASSRGEISADEDARIAGDNAE